MNAERGLMKKRGLFGYRPKEVKTKIQSIKNDYLMESEQLLQEITMEKNKNSLLKTKLAEMKDQAVHHTIAEELSSQLSELLLEHNKAIYELTNELQEQEKILVAQLEKKHQEKQLLLERIQDAFDYLNHTKMELEKELI
jgi:transposase